ncbi:MAG: hypothetical protein L6Q84_08405 [Polyangiaceae bacterium]|nr:hypothetical protein [Polyangiaceae bacterium]
MRCISAALVAGALLAAVHGCQRQADLVDEPDAAVAITQTPKYDGDLPLLDAHLESDAHAACEDRPMEACKGPNDFVCGFGEWAREIARDCQRQTGCKTNGWVTVTIGDDGCVSDLGMDRPYPPIVECLVQKLSETRCPCPAQETTYYFGEGNAGPCPDGGPKG